MNFITGLIIGLIIGWIIEWLIDWFYWRRKDQAYRRQLAECEKNVTNLRAELADAEILAADAQRKINKQKQQLAEAEQTRRQLDAQVVGNQRLHKKLIEAEEEIGQLKNQLIDYDHNRNALDASLSQIADLRNQLANSYQKASQKPDSLEQIRGIGTSFAKRLNDAGIYSYAQLAELTPDHVREIVAAKKWHKIDPESWIAEAKQRSQEAARGNQS